MTREQADHLRDELQRAFSGQAEVEPVATDRYRFAVVSTQFTGVSPLERQDQVWAVVDRVLPQQETLGISLILTYAPEELQPA